MNNLKSIETESLNRLKRVTANNQFIYPVQVNVTEVNNGKSWHAYVDTNGHMLQVIDYIEVVLENQPGRVNIHVTRIDTQINNSLN